jgi:zinc transporter ZupT
MPEVPIARLWWELAFFIACGIGLHNFAEGLTTSAPMRPSSAWTR